jgi:hypothetical protein
MGGAESRIRTQVPFSFMTSLGHCGVRVEAVLSVWPLDASSHAYSTPQSQWLAVCGQLVPEDRLSEGRMGAVFY